VDLPLDFLAKLDIASLLAIGGLLWVFNARSDKKFDKLDAKIDKVDTRIDKLDAKIDRNEAKFNAKLDSKIDPLEKDLIQMNTRMAVIESRLSDISTNVTYLMWHNQAIPPKEELKEN
jgi:predicted  nucleic acid-binding Zn-ribbon protein